jgi:hypothetical protein
MTSRLLIKTKENEMAKLSKFSPLAFVGKRLVRDKDGDLLFRHEVEEACDRDCATIEKVKNENPDVNEAKEYTIIKCSEFQLQLTDNDIKDLQARYDKTPHKPKAKTTKKGTRKPKASSK